MFFSPFITGLHVFVFTGQTHTHTGALCIILVYFLYIHIMLILYSNTCQKLEYVSLPPYPTLACVLFFHTFKIESFNKQVLVLIDFHLSLLFYGFHSFFILRSPFCNTNYKDNLLYFLQKA